MYRRPPPSVRWGRLMVIRTGLPGQAGPNDRMPSGSPLAREPPELAKSRPAEGALCILVRPGCGDELPE